MLSRPLFVLLLMLAVPVTYAGGLSPALVQALDEADGCDGEGGDLFMDTREGELVEAYAREQISRAEQKHQAGDPLAAYKILDQVSGQVGFCISDQSSQRRYSLRTQVLKELGDEAEKKGKLQQAFDWFDHDDEHFIKDMERVMMKMVKAKPADLGTIGTAFNFFERHQMTDSLRAVRAMALQNAKQSLVDEDKQFQSKQSELYGKAYRSLEQAQKWLEFVEAPENRMAMERADKRGDSLASQTTPYYLKETIKYYGFAKKTEKIKSMQGKAKKLGDEAKGRSDNHLAVEYYEIAGLREQAGSLKKATEAREEKDEDKRQKQFKKDRDKLEDELGL